VVVAQQRLRRRVEPQDDPPTPPGRRHVLGADTPQALQQRRVVAGCRGVDRLAHPRVVVVDDDLEVVAVP
jgi:hypothetical protein